MRLLKFIGAIVGCALILLGGLGTLVSIHALIDPAFVQGSNDADPLGPPPTFLHSFGILLAYVALGAIGVYLLWIFCRQRRLSV
jgi:hypothetical protein